MLLGRAEESARLKAVLVAAQEGTSGGLVICGEPGVGKTALLGEARILAASMPAVTVRGTEFESALPYAGLHALISPFLELLGDVPPPQRDALRAALGLINQPTNAFAVYAGTLSTLVRAAGDDGLLVLVDDFQWLDAASQGAIRFVARRIGAEGLAIVVTVRDDAEAVDLGLPELGLAGLPVPQALALVAQTGVRLVDHVARDLVAVTRGNPLALREIPALLSEGQRQGVEALPDPFPVGPTIERAFGQRLRALDPASRACLAATAASDSGEIELSWPYARP